MNDYEQACERFNHISGIVEEVKQLAQSIIDWAEAEYGAAQDNLRRYESKPGIPLPQYRRGRHEVTA